MRILENRLEKAYHKLNATRSGTQGVRASVDNLRRERLVFDDILAKSQRGLGTKRREMAALLRGLHQATLAKEKVGTYFSSFFIMNTRHKKEGVAGCDTAL